MIKNILNRISKTSSRNYKIISFERKMIIREMMANELEHERYNPRKARSKSMKGISFHRNDK